MGGKQKMNSVIKNEPISDDVQLKIVTNPYAVLLDVAKIEALKNNCSPVIAKRANRILEAHFGQ